MPPTLAPTCLRALTPLRSPSASAIRTLSTTSLLFYKQTAVPKSTIPIPSVSAPHPEIPPYPLGPRQAYHQSNTGLYGSASIRFGNKVSSRNEIKTRRAWRPNVHHKRLWSESLSCFVRTRVTTRVLRTIDKVGGLDAYLLGIKPARIAELGPWGWRLRWRIMQAPKLRAKLNAEREALGLPLVPLDPTKVAVVEGLGASGQSVAQLMEETDRMLAKEEEFSLSEEAEKDTFMHEPNMRLKDLKA
ncbi:hypothetical protein B0T16DRAFT_414939 [Cercophora newfieldiana]|uniref:Large ribosomal subunit protein bL28m n=1 Tax=Cercophora newfieldiana TaxID=92897 RepID=A0AA39XZ22_9PEZI|nr:hypothetical protein B0T16DRAFT_414939 [Cercophora newfieldiana]